MTDKLVAGWGPLFSSWQLYALAVIGLGSFLIMQAAFQVGPFAASQSTLILVNPFVSIVVGAVLYGESLRGGALYPHLGGVLATRHGARRDRVCRRRRSSPRCTRDGQSTISWRGAVVTPSGADEPANGLVHDLHPRDWTLRCDMGKAAR